MTIKKMNDDDLVWVTAGTADELKDIIAVFRKHGFEDEAKKLERAGIFFFETTFKSVLQGLGFTHSLYVQAYDNQRNFKTYNGKIVENYEVVEILDEFLNRKANNLPWGM